MCPGVFAVVAAIAAIADATTQNDESFKDTIGDERNDGHVGSENAETPKKQDEETTSEKHAVSVI